MKFLLFLCCCCFFAHRASGQGLLKIEATLVDSLSGQAVPNANIFLKSNRNSGTFSNEAGEFRFTVATRLRADTLMISVLGYKTKMLPVNDLARLPGLVIALSPTTLILDPVVVLASKDVALEIATDALKNLRKNLLRRQYLMEGFYRELALRDCTYVRLIEAAVHIQDHGYGSSLDRRKIKVIELRKSEDFLTYGWGTKMIKFFFGEDNQLISTLNSDFIRNYKNDPTLAPIDSKPFLSEYNFTLDGYSSIDSDSVAVISFSSEKSNFSRPFYEGKLFVNLRDMAILRFDHGMFANPDRTLRDQGSVFYQGRFFFMSSVQYRKIEGKYFPSRITMTKPVNFDAVEGTQGQQYATYDLAVLTVHTRKSDFDRIRIRDAQRRDLDLYRSDFTYNPAFWEDFNYIKINPLLTKAKTDLEKIKKLEQQFKNKN